MFRRDALDRDFDEELAAHVAMAIEDYRRQGVPVDEARRRALGRFGGMTAARQQHRESRGLPSLDAILQDVRYAVRSLRRSPGVTLTALVTLALGIGANATMFTLVDAVLFKGFPLVERNDRLLYVTSRGYGCCTSYPDFEDWRAQARSFVGMAAVHGIGVTLGDDRGFSERHQATEITAGTFALAGQRPFLGRDFTAADQVPGAPRVVILRYDFWQNRYGGDPGAIGGTVRIDGTPATIVGVMPAGFSFPQNQDVWVPLVRTADVEKREARNLWMAFGRLSDTATVAGARAEMAAIGARLAAAYPATNQGQPPVVQTFTEFFVGPNAATLYLSLWGAVGFVLLIACANLANLMLARAIDRSRELSLRLALGAGRWRIVRQLLVESMLLSALGGLLAWGLVAWGVRAYQLADRSWRVLDHALDARVFVYLAAVSMLAGIVSGLIPALRLSLIDVNATLKDGGRGAAGGSRGRRMSAALVAGEMALAIVLLAGAAVMIRSLLVIYTADLGVRRDNVLALQLALPEARYPDPAARIAFIDRLAQRLAAVPGVDAIALANQLPAARALALPYQIDDGPQVEATARPTLGGMVVGPGYFATLGASLRAGREFTDFDNPASPLVAIVNERFAAEHWPGESPIGRRLRLFDKGAAPGWLTVVGLVSNIAQNAPQPAGAAATGPREAFDPLVYLPYRQRPLPDVEVLARTGIAPAALAPDFRRVVPALDADLPVGNIWTLAQWLEWPYREKITVTALFAVFALMALFLAAIGLYAVVAHGVGQRTQEFGVRMAVGATAGDVLRLVLRQALPPLGAGLGIGLAAAFAVTPLLRSALAEVSPTDPLAFAAAAGALVIAALLGCLVPARRAMRVDPLVALRHD